MKKILDHSTIDSSTNLVNGSHCWRWTGTIRDNGYGQIKHGKKIVKAHRLSYELACGPITSDDIIRHKCDNRLCVNPDHLDIGTHQDNINDKISRGRDNKRHLTDADIIAIKTSTERNKDLSAQYSVSKGFISNIQAGRHRRLGV